VALVRVPEVFTRASFWVRFHAVLTVVWILLIIPSLLWWRESLPWLVTMSVWANIAGSAASWMAARGDCNSPNVEDIRRLSNQLSAHDAVVFTKLEQIDGRISTIVAQVTWHDFR
jgi:hypothetical protein